jgi:hypothetical protein
MISPPLIAKLSRYKLQIVLTLCAIASPALLGWLIVHFAVNVPYWDQWHTPGSLFKIIYENKQIAFTDLIAQHNESRKFFPRLIFLANAYFTHWDTRYEILLIFLMACLISINVLQVARKTINDLKRFRILLFLAVSNLLIFSPAQYENWWWGIQIVVFIPALCLMTGILTCYSNLKIQWKVLLGALLATISTFSYANGLLCWFLLPWAAILSGHGKALKGRVELLVFWAVACISNLALYFWNYHKPQHHPSFLDGLAHPVKALTYFLAFLGSPLSGGSVVVATMVGFFVIALYGIILGLLLSGWRNENLRYRVAGWLTLASYVLVSAIITTLGRVGFGIEQALASRYTTFSVYGIVALVALTMIVFDPITLNGLQSPAQTITPLANSANSPVRIMEEKKTIVLPAWLSALSLARLMRYVPLGLVTILVVLHVMVQGFYLNAMESTYRDRLYAKTCLTYADFVEDTCISQSLFPIAADPNYFRGTLTALRGLKLIENRSAQTAKLTPAPSSVAPGSYGWLDEIHLISENEFSASGWATLGKPERSADAVLLSYQDDEGSFKVFTVAPVKYARPDVAKVKRNDACHRSGWNIKFSRNSLPTRKVEIRGWAYDTKTEQIFPLAGAKILPFG